VADTYSLADRLPRYLKTRELQVFLAVAESRSIAEAARRLASTQPAVSKSINELESTLGVTLFERDSAAFIQPVTLKSCVNGRWLSSVKSDWPGKK